ncbi:uncharacterized protein LOC135115010 isoform X4 [Scylla paramamosain]|uniref:uncharacterized protein LOC135115010 isoform X4 n=1 Tax=Scylla paramamosain TaxID=85552 RepID=UPI003083E053
MLHLSRLLLPSEVVTACHSLVYLEEGLVGDPQEKATLAKTDWILTKEEIIGWLCVMSNALSLRATPRATHQQQQEDEEERTFTSCLIQCDWGFFQQLARVQRQAEQEVSVHPREMHSTQPQHRQAPAPSPSASHSWTPQLQHCVTPVAAEKKHVTMEKERLQEEHKTVEELLLQRMLSVFFWPTVIKLNRWRLETQ